MLEVSRTPCPCLVLDHAHVPPGCSRNVVSVVNLGGPLALIYGCDGDGGSGWALDTFTRARTHTRTRNTHAHAHAHDRPQPSRV